MFSRITIRVVAVATALALAGCAGPGAGGGDQSGTKMIDSKVWAWYQQYLRDIAPSNPGAFAVSMSGRGAYYVYCQELRCQSGTSYKREALKGCRNTTNSECYIFGFKSTIEVAYKVRD